MTPIDTFWCEETDLVQLSLRVNAEGDCDNPWGYHRAERVIHPGWPGLIDEDGYLKWRDPADYADNPAWPQSCDHCDHAFDAGKVDCYVDVERVYELPDGTHCPHGSLPAGACYHAGWIRAGRDGISLTVVCPPAGGTIDHWHVDSTASNCGQPEDKDSFCWARTGDPKAGTVDVGSVCDRDCGVGAGSIRTHAWHGYLRHGQLVE